VRRAPLFALVIAAGFFDTLAAAARPASPRNLTCAPTPEVKAALATVPRRDPACEPADDCWVDKIRKAEALVDRYPFDLHVNRRYQDIATARNNDEEDPFTKAAADRYRRFADDFPDDPLAHYLLARFNDDRDEAGKALALNPTFPWPHALLASLIRGQDPQPPAEVSAAAGSELEAFARLCPDRFDEVLRRDLTVGDPALWQRLLPQARAALRKGPPDEQIPWYPTLWDREFAAWPPAGHQDVRARLRADLTRIEAFRRRDERAWWETLRSGYQMLDDPQGLERIEAAYVKRMPCEFLGVQRTLAAYVDARGGAGHIHDQTPAQWRDTFDQGGRWVKTCPDNYQYLALRFEAAAHLADLDDRAFIAEADRYVAAWDRIRASWTVFPWPEAEVAAEFLSRGIEPDRALALARKAQAADAAERAKRAEAESRWTEDQKRQIANSDLVGDFATLGLVAEAALAAGRRDECDAALAKADALYRGFDDALRAQLANAPGSHARYWRVRARIAEADRRSADALADWRLAAEHADPRTTSTSGRDGAAPKSDALPWDTPGDPLPPFSLTDLDGHTWTLAELTGKTLFINVWATWCGPCKAEIPHLRDLHERLRDRRDVVLLSFNTDDSAGVVAPFARANQMTWPVLFASAYFESLGGAMSIPQNWVVDGAGVRRDMQLGFDFAHPDAWIESALGAIDRAGATAPAGAPAGAAAAAATPPHP
jgi:thiol-disulfide isomerase/thioredoxin